MGYEQKYKYGLVGLFPSGSLYVYIESDKRETWNETDYFYGEFSWVEQEVKHGF